MYMYTYKYIYICVCIYIHIYNINEKDKFSGSLAPNWFKWINQLRPREAWFQKTVRSAIFFWRCQPRNFQYMTLVVCRRAHFQEVLAIFLVAHLPPKMYFSTQEFTRFLSTESSQCPRALTCPFKKSYLSAWSPFSYIPLRETQFYPCCLLPTVMVTPSDSNYVKWSAALKRFFWIMFTTNELVDRMRNFKSNASRND